jgi:FkbM family methyltransferase
VDLDAPEQPGQRLERLWRYAQVQAAGRTARGGRRPRAVVVPYGLHARMRCFLDPASSKRAAYYRVPDWPEMLVWQRVLEPGDLFVDIGANVGLYTIWAADLGAEVVAFEPVEPSRRQLQDNIDLNGFGCLVHEQADGAEPGRVQMEGADLNRQHMVVDGGEPACRRQRWRPWSTVLDGQVVTSTTSRRRFAAGVKVDVEAERPCSRPRARRGPSASCSLRERPE